jgi:hypothetical protein
MSLQPSNPKPQKSGVLQKVPRPLTLVLAAVLGLGLVSLLPKFNNPNAATKENPTPSGATVTLENYNSQQSHPLSQASNQPEQENQPQNQQQKEPGEQGGQIKAYWSSPTSQAQFWFDGKPATASCDEYNCLVPKPKGANQVYLRWFNTGENQWYYFQCNADYKGRFEGIPYGVKF